MMEFKHATLSCKKWYDALDYDEWFRVLLLCETFDDNLEISVDKMEYVNSEHLQWVMSPHQSWACYPEGEI